ncbi:peptide-binding protein [Clostridium carboxidivorans P7]|uniref:SH3 type 3 domain protein n=1 Tax=Clostridium carboxidivorans P7 TaxID=536227 RepID=C6PWR4_9CLOT|nr:SH3 domain-containing protein [Clostridium carboxidivorans]AKN32003.1 peptide-binding protein [Clostridium carboxidivorans P7]EET86289.1 SH3 type 3 domain protein [Clostridium carboxidivorans P7]EFG87860.1 bacterial SH3 domain protein [Clostridium carboxidivorans P7]
MKIFKSKLLVALFLATSIIAPTQSVNAASQQSITRSEAEQRALNMINLSWNYSSDKNGVLLANYNSSVTQPSQLKDAAAVTTTGIPYNWGGQDSLDSNSYGSPWSNFLDAVNKGAFTGNVNTEAGFGYISGTAGIDCSGFVQATFNVKDSKLSTSSMFDTYFTKINLNDIKHMDILDKPYDHVVIFDKWGTQNGVTGAFTYESTPDQTYGGIQGTKKYFISMDEINKGYIAGRYVNIVEDSSNTPPISNTTGNTSNIPHPVDAGIFAKITNVTTAANFRSKASTDSSIIGTIPKDTILYLIDYSAGWYQISYNGQTGWVWGNLITSIPSGKYVTINKVYQLNIRNNPSTSADILGYLSQNQYAEVINYSNDGKWLKIRINGIEGYASGAYLRYIY